MASLVITPNEATGVTLGVTVTATLVGIVDGERQPITGIVTGTDRVIVRPTVERVTSVPFSIDIDPNAAIAPGNSYWLIDVGGDEFLIEKGAGSETLEDALAEDLLELTAPVAQQLVDDAVAGIVAAGEVTGSLGALQISASGTRDDGLVLGIAGGALAWVAGGSGGGGDIDGGDATGTGSGSDIDGGDATGT